MRRLHLLLLALPLTLAAAQPQQPVRNVVLVMSDGLRWQEAFNGLDEALLNKANGKVEDPTALRKDFWRATPAERRAALMPFLWTTIAKQGQIYGNPATGSDAHVSNQMFFSYPGYSETLCGFADDARINSNDKNPNPNVTVLEWLNSKPAYKGKVAAFGAWDTFPAIINAERAKFPVNAGHDAFTMPPVTPTLALLNRLKAETQVMGGEALDALTFHTTMEYVKAHKPRVLFLSLGETDEWAHDGNYELYARAANRVDVYTAELWKTLQSMPEYRGNTALVVAVDHGRGQAPQEWRGHGQKVPDSRFIWMAFMGPTTPALGERSNVAPVTQSQIAATIAALLGEDYNAAQPKAGKPIADVIKK